MSGTGLRSRITASSLVLFVLSMVALQAAAWNGRLGNGDTYQQLLATVHAVQTGTFGVDTTTFDHEVVPTFGATGGHPHRTRQWTQSDNGRWYQVHDVGNKLLMAPAAAFTTVIGNQPRGDLRPTPLTKFLAAATIAAFAILLPVFLLLALRVVMSERAALGWAALGLVATILLPYVKAAWDVMPCAVFVAGAVWLSLRRLATPLDAPGGLRASVAFGALCGGAGLFRFSMMPTMALAFVLTEIVVARRHGSGLRTTAARLGAGLATMALVLLPELWMNVRESGRFWRPGTARLASQARFFSLRQLQGFAGLLASPNRGLFVFSPVLLLLVALPFVWMRLPSVTRTYVAVWAVPVIGYVLAIGSVPPWGAFGWGPRYLVPVVPILWIPVACAGDQLLRRRSVVAVAVVAIIGVSVLFAVAPTVTNWDAVAGLDGSITAQDTAYPKQIVETIRYTGRRIPLASTSDTAGVDTRRWPDLVVVSGARKAHVPDAVGYLFVLALLAASAAAFAAARRAGAGRDAATRDGP